MLLKNGTTGELLDTTQYTLSAGAYAAAATWPLLSTNPTDVAYVGTLTSGSPYAYVGQTAFGFLNFSVPGNPTVYTWKLATRAIVLTALTNITAWAEVPHASGTLNLTTGVVS